MRQGASLAPRNDEGCQEPALWSGREAPSSSGRRRRRAARRTRRSVSIAPPKAGRGTECARPELSLSGACAALRQGSSPNGRRRDWLAMTAVWSVERLRARTRLEPGPKGTHQTLLPPILKLGRPISTL
jgi:hypothetical protein